MLTPVGRLAVISGTGLRGSEYEESLARVDVDGVAFLDAGTHLVLPRHGVDDFHRPHEIDHRAHVRALQAAGVDRVLGLSSVGSLRLDWAVGTNRVSRRLLRAAAHGLDVRRRPQPRHSRIRPFVAGPRHRGMASSRRVTTSGRRDLRPRSRAPLRDAGRSPRAGAFRRPRRDDRRRRMHPHARGRDRVRRGVHRRQSGQRSRTDAAHHRRVPRRRGRQPHPPAGRSRSCAPFTCRGTREPHDHQRDGSTTNRSGSAPSTASSRPSAST